MNQFFKKKEWQEETMPQIEGKAAELELSFFDFPCRKIVGTSERRCRYGTFIADLQAALLDAFGNYNAVSWKMTLGETVSATLTLRRLPEFTVELKGRADRNKEKFYLDLAAAVEHALKKAAIKP